MQANPSGAVYGTIAVSAVLAAESPRQETYARTIVAVVITMLLYWLAHSYADLAGERIETGEPLTFAELGRAMVRELWILLGSATPLLVVLICWATGTSLYDAVRAAVWTAAAIIIATEVGIGLHSELSGRELAGQVAVGASLGLLIIALRVVLH